MTDESEIAVGQADLPVMRRMRQRAEFEQALHRAPFARSEHFALHHCGQLSTGNDSSGIQPVENSGPAVFCLGVMIPKRWAKRSVTRSLLKRQCRSQLALAAPGLVPGAWLLRLRRTFDTREFPSAASDALRRAVLAELRELLARARSTVTSS